MQFMVLLLGLMSSVAARAEMRGEQRTVVVKVLPAPFTMMGGCMSDDDCNDGYRCVGQVMGPPCDFNNPQPGCNQYGPGFCSP